MNTYKFKYIVTSERLSYLYADSQEEAKDKLMKILKESDTEADAINKIEEKYVRTLNETRLGIDFQSIELVKDVDSEE